MPKTFLDWVEFLANVITILGVSSFLIAYIGKKVDAKRQATEVMVRAVKSASLSLAIYELSSQKIYVSSDYVRFFKEKLETWSGVINDFEVDTAWKDSDDYFLPSELESLKEMTEQSDEAYSRDFIFSDDTGQQWLGEHQMQDYLREFRKKSKDEQQQILRLAISKDILGDYLRVIEAELYVSETTLGEFIDHLLHTIDSEGILYNPYLNQEIDWLKTLRMALDELLNYQKDYVEALLNSVIDFENPFLLFQEKWRSKNKLSIEFSTEVYLERRLEIVNKLLTFFERVEKHFPN